VKILERSAKLEKELLRTKQELIDTKLFYEERIAELEAQIQKLQKDAKRLKEQKLG
jgi:hypothetical protein